MDTFYSLEKLDAFLIANEIAEQIWNNVVRWKSFEKNTLGKQIVKSADSIAANISEGYGRYYYKDNIRFCYYAIGSLAETKL